jgi:murein DD-endopeptidase MepM/ murein hydrolase activator NlpD
MENQVYFNFIKTNGLYSMQNIKNYALSIIILIVWLTWKPATSQTHSSVKKDSIQTISSDSLSKTNVLKVSDLGPFYFPIHGKVISHFGKRGRQNHTGTDIKLNHGDTVRAGFKGIVALATTHYGYGKLVVLDHGTNIETYYAHLSKILVKNGDTVTQGAVLGLGGRTGRATTDHLHFEIRSNHQPINPELLFDFNNLKVLTSTISLSSEKSASKHVSRQNNSDARSNFHVIEKDDTLYSIAKRYGTTVKFLCNINGITPTSVLKIGSKLKIIY